MRKPCRRRLRDFIVLAIVRRKFHDLRYFCFKYQTDDNKLITIKLYFLPNNDISSPILINSDKFEAFYGKTAISQVINFINENSNVEKEANSNESTVSINLLYKYYKSNVTGTINVLASCNSSKLSKLIYAGSSSCYGIPDEYPTPETAEIRLEYPYALTKRIGEELVLHWHKVYGLKVVSTRFFNVYGTRSRTSGTYGAVFGVFLAQKLANKPLTVVGDGTQSRDFTYVTDICNGLYLAAKSKCSGEVYNLGSGGTQSINYLASLIGRNIIYIPMRPGEPKITFADISKAQINLGYQPQISFEQGVQNVLNEISYWKSAPVWDSESIEVATKSWFKYLT
jgi:UDP-glucose 4-epimerase